VLTRVGTAGWSYPHWEPELYSPGLAARDLTQEELAEAAGLSPRSVSDLERGINRTARKDTALLLADALSLAGQVRVLFVAAARRRAPAADVLAAASGGCGAGRVGSGGEADLAA
jgi:DNA-binding XRE family transcriptional regulator